jgi:hypothetical protein
MTDRKIFIILILAVILMPLFCLSCAKDYLDITREDFSISGIPTNWTVISQEKINEWQAAEEEGLGDDSNRIKANVLFHAGLDRGANNIFPSVVVEVIPLGNFKTIEEVIDYNEGIYVEILDEYERLSFVSSPELATKDLLAILIYQYRYEEKLLVSTDVWVINKNIVWRIGATSLAEEFREDVVVYSTIFNSFEIKDGNITLGNISMTYME